MFHADGRTDITKLIVAFWDIANPPKKGKSVSYTAPNTPHYGCNDNGTPNNPYYGYNDNRAPNTPYYGYNDNTSPDSLKWIYHFFNLSCRTSA